MTISYDTKRNEDKQHPAVGDVLPWRCGEHDTARGCCGRYIVSQEITIRQNQPNTPQRS